MREPNSRAVAEGGVCSANPQSYLYYIQHLQAADAGSVVSESLKKEENNIIPGSAGVYDSSPFFPDGEPSAHNCTNGSPGVQQSKTTNPGAPAPASPSVSRIPEEPPVGPLTLVSPETAKVVEILRGLFPQR